MSIHPSLPVVHQEVESPHGNTEIVRDNPQKLVASARGEKLKPLKQVGLHTLALPWS